jgi:hypothetical protein
MFNEPLHKFHKPFIFLCQKGEKKTQIIYSCNFQIDPLVLACLAFAKDKAFVTKSGSKIGKHAMKSS